MSGSMTTDIEAWEGKGGAPPTPPGASAASMNGTASQAEWVARFKRRVKAELDRVAATKVMSGEQAG